MGEGVDGNAYTNKEISILTGEKWSEPSVKLYTLRIIVKDSTPKRQCYKSNSKYDFKGSNLEQVKMATSIQKST